MGIIGAGISGLTLANRLINHPLLKITIFEKNYELGGRVFTQTVAPNTYADLGANIIDFESPSQEQNIRSFLSTLSNNQNSSLRLFTKPFLIYEKGTLRKGDYEKARYFYVNGFRQLLIDLEAKINEQPSKC